MEPKQTPPLNPPSNDGQKSTPVVPPTAGVAGAKPENPSVEPLVLPPVVSEEQATESSQDTTVPEPVLAVPPPVDINDPADATASPSPDGSGVGNAPADTTLDEQRPVSSQLSMSDEKARVRAQIEAAANQLSADAQPAVGATIQPATDSTASLDSELARTTSAPQNIITASDAPSIGTAIDLESIPTAEPTPGFVPASPYTADPYAKQNPRSRRRTSKRLVVGISLICFALVLCIGVGAYSVWYVKTNVLSSVAYVNYQPVSVKGAEGLGGLVVELPAEYSEDSKTDSGIEYTHRVPSDKGEGNYSGIAISSSKITDTNQTGQIDALKTELRDKESEASKQFVAMINGSLSGQQVVTLDNYIEKSNATGQNFFGYNITLSQNENQVGRGWMLITNSKTHIYVMVLYGTDKVWADNTKSWQYIFDSLQVNPS